MINLEIQPFFIPTLLLFVVSIPLIFNCIPPNKYYGVRTAITLSGKDTWYRGNSWFGRMGVLASIFYLEIAFEVPYNKQFTTFLFHLMAFVGPWVLIIVIGKHKKLL